MSASFRYHNYSHARDIVVVNIKARWSRGVLIHCVGWLGGCSESLCGVVSWGGGYLVFFL